MRARGRYFLCSEVLVMLCILMSACHRVNPETDLFPWADSLSESNPREAVRMIDSVGDCLDMSHPDVEAYYQLTRIKIYDRAYIPHTQDSTICRVIDYYEQHPYGNRLAWAYCYGGRVCRDLNDAPRALSYFQRSLDVMDPDEDAGLRARVLSQIGYIYYGQNLFAEARDVKLQVLAIDSLAGNYDRMAVGYKDLAQCSFALSDLDGARTYIARALTLADKYGLERRRADILLLDARIALADERYEEAYALIGPYLTDSTLLNPVPYLVVGGEVCLGLHRYDEAEHLCLGVLHDGRNLQACYKATRMLSEVCRMNGQQQRMVAYQEQSAALLDSIYSADQHDEIRRVSELYNIQLRDRENQLLQMQVRQSRLWLVVALLSAFVMMLLLGIVWFRYSRKQMELKLQRIRIAHLQQEIALQGKSIGELTEHLSQLQSQKEDFDVVFRSSTLYTVIKSHIADQTILSASDWAEIEQFFEAHLPQLLPRLRQLYDFSEVEWRLSLLVRLSLRNVEIASLLCKHPSAITYAKKRLCIKVLEAEPVAEDWERFVRGL